MAEQPAAEEKLVLKQGIVAMFLQNFAPTADGENYQY